MPPLMLPIAGAVAANMAADSILATVRRWAPSARPAPLALGGPPVRRRPPMGLRARTYPLMVQVPRGDRRR